MLKDHLGNVRMVLTEEQKTDAYPAASMETAQTSTEEALYANLPQTRENKPSGYPNDTYTSPNDKVAKTNGSGNKIGPAITLKVMAGDKLNIRVSSWYKTYGAYPQVPNPITELGNALAYGLAGASGGKATATDLINGGISSNAANSFLSNQPYNSSRPKAFINWMFLDEQFKYYAGSVEQVGDNEEFKVHLFNNIPASKSGYLYVYVSNETPNIDVFFDNLQVTHIRGAILETNEYYPFGLQMKNLCYRTFKNEYIENKRMFNCGTELNKEFNINLYETIYRNHDPQLGRFLQIDLLSESTYDWSPFAFSNNNPITYCDPLGLDTTINGIRLTTSENNCAVTVSAKRRIPSEFIPFISFPNGGSYSIASSRDWPLSFSKDRSNDLLDSWSFGLGATNRVYLPGHKMTKRLQDAFKVNRARIYFYKKYLKDFKNNLSLKGGFVRDYAGKFGPREFVLAGFDLVEQFVGSMDIDIEVDEKGENLLFIVSNTTSKTSAYYHMADSHERSSGKMAEGNMYQVYIWKEPINKALFSVAEESIRTRGQLISENLFIGF